MSIELKQAAEKALVVLGSATSFMSRKARDQHESVVAELRTAIQQAEAHQPATSEPVVSRNPFASRCYTMSESHLSGHRLIVGFEKLGDAQDAHEWVSRQGRGDFTHPAPGVPVGWPTDAEIEMNIWPLLRLRGHEALTLHDCIAAIRAASPAQKGGE